MGVLYIIFATFLQGKSFKNTWESKEGRNFISDNHASWRKKNLGRAGPHRAWIVTRGVEGRPEFIKASLRILSLWAQAGPRPLAGAPLLTVSQLLSTSSTVPAPTNQFLHPALSSSCLQLVHSLCFLTAAASPSWACVAAAVSSSGLGTVAGSCGTEPGNLSVERAAVMAWKLMAWVVQSWLKDYVWGAPGSAQSLKHLILDFRVLWLNPMQAPCWVWSLLKFLSLPLPLHTCACALWDGGRLCLEYLVWFRDLVLGMQCGEKS